MFLSLYKNVYHFFVLYSDPVRICIFIWEFLYWVRYGKGEIITSGPYRLCRHPQYLGIIVAALGFTLLTMSPIANISWLIMTYIYILMASIEEYHIAMEISEYVDYKKKCTFIIPYIRILRPIDSKKDIFIYQDGYITDIDSYHNQYSTV